MPDKELIGLITTSAVDRAERLRGAIRMVRSLGNTVTVEEVDRVLAKQPDDIRNDATLREELVNLATE